MKKSHSTKRVVLPRLKLSRRDKERMEWTEMLNKLESFQPPLSATGS